MLPPDATCPPLFILLQAPPGPAGQALAQDRAERIRQQLTQADRPHTLWIASRPDELPERLGRALHAARQAQGVLAAAGDNASLSAIVHAACNARLPLALLPLTDAAATPGRHHADHGSFAHTFAHAHGLPDNLADALRALLMARPRPLPVGQAGGRLFVHHADLGLPFAPDALPDAHDTPPPARALPWPRRCAALAQWLTGRDLLHIDLQALHHHRVLRARSLRVTLCHHAAALPLIATTPPLRSAWQDLWPLLPGIAPMPQSPPTRHPCARLTLRPQRPHRQRIALPVTLDGNTVHLNAPLHIHPAPTPLIAMLPPNSQANHQANHQADSQTDNQAVHTPTGNT